VTDNAFDVFLEVHNWHLEHWYTSYFFVPYRMVWSEWYRNFGL